MKQLLILALVLLSLGCANNQDFVKKEVPVALKETYQAPVKTESTVFKKGKLQLRVQGFKNIKEESYPWFCCGDDDNMLLSTGFSAETPEGERVEGCMCSAMFKGVTIRFK